MHNYKSRKPAHRSLLTALFLLSVISSAIFVSSAWGTTIVSVTVNYNTTTSYNKLSPGFMVDWESKAFSGSNTLQQLAQAANFKLVRLFDVRIQPCTWWYESSKTGVFNWASVDLLIRSIFNSGAQPLICFGHFATAGAPPTVPKGMAINPNTKLPYPASYAAYCVQWVNHFKSLGLPVKYYEVMNEGYFYYGWNYYETTLISNFVQLVNTILRGMRSASSGLLIGYNAFLQKKFLDYYVKYGDNLDWIGFTKYGLGESGGTDAQAFYNAQNQMFTTSSPLWYTLDQGRSIWYSKRGKSLPVIFTESNFSYAWMNGSDPRNQQMAGAVYTALILRESVLRGINYHCYYVFSSNPSYQQGSNGFGMVNSDTNKPWYPYYVQQWLGTSLSVGDQLATLTTSSSEISGFAWTHSQKLYFLLICDVNEARTVYFNGLQGSINFTKIDNTISWLTPKVQTGTISSSQSLNMNGYTVALFQAQASDPIISPTVFEDGFESGNFGKWTGTSIRYGETATVLTTKPYSGIYSAKFTTNGNVNEVYANSYESVNMSEVYVRGYFYINSGLPLVDNQDCFYLLRLAGSKNLAYAGIGHIGGIDRWVLLVRNGANWMGWNTVASPLPESGSWVSVELHWKKDPTQGLAELYINGAKIITVGGINTSYYGNATRVDFGLPYALGVQNSLVIYGDSAKISKTYVGP